MVAKWLKDHFEWVWWSVFLLSALPGAILLVGCLSHTLGSNPLAEFMRSTGSSALLMLMITLAVTPVRKWATNAAKATHLRFGKRLADWNWLIRLRRQLGLWCFFYALCHASVYVSLDLNFDWEAGWQEVLEKPYLAAGMGALALLVPLAATSTPGMIRMLGKNWRRLHMLTYVVALLGLVHYWLMQKPGVTGPVPETLVITVLLGYRLLLHSGLLTRWDGYDGTDSAERRPVAPNTTSHKSINGK